MADLTTLQTLSNGDVPKEGYYNDIFARKKKYTFTSAAEETHTGDTAFTTIKTGTLTPDDTSDNIILAAKVSCDLKNGDSGTVTYANLQIGSWNLIVGDVSGQLAVTGLTYTTKTEKVLVGQPYSTGATSSHAPTYVPMADSSYTVNFQIKTSAAGETAYARNVVITVYVLQGPMDSATPAFS